MINHSPLHTERRLSAMHLLTVYIGLLYPSDHIALPSKGGAMENWGLITYGEEILAINPGTSSVTGRQTCGVIIAHELAHQVHTNLILQLLISLKYS